MSEQTQTKLTEAQAIAVVVQGVRREARKDSERTLDYCKDAVKLQGHNVRKIAQKAQARAELEREEVQAKLDAGEDAVMPAAFNADSYQSNVSNATGVMALFEFDIERFEEWLKTAESKSLSKIFKLFRELFTEPKPAKPAKDQNSEESANADSNTEPKPLIDVVLSAIPMLTAEERQLVAMMIIELDTKADDEAEVAA